MKKVLGTILALLLTYSAFGQQGEKSVGLNLGYGTELKTFKIGANFNYCITDAIELAPSFEYFFKNDDVSQWAINLDGHYLIPIQEKLRFYPLVGLTVTGFHVSVDSWEKEVLKAFGVDNNVTRFGVNVGAGIKYEVADNIDIGFELKYQAIKDYGQAVFGFSVAYKF